MYFFFGILRAIRRLNLQHSLSHVVVGQQQGRRPDKFRIYVRRRDKPEHCGYRDVMAEVHDKKQRETETESTSSDFRGWPRPEFPQPPVVQYPLSASKSGTFEPLTCTD